MRILPSEIQPLINTLIWKLQEVAKDPQSGISQIDLYDFPVNDPLASDNIVFTRGTSFHWSEIAKKSNNIPYKLCETEQHISLGQIILNAIKKIIPGISENDSPKINRQKAQEATYGPENLPLHQQGFWDVLIQVMSYEAYRFEQDAGGYLTTLSNWNAADAIPWFLADFSPKATYRGFAQGYRQVVVNMAQLFTKAGGNIVCGQKLASFDWDGDGNVFMLKFANGNTVMTKALILAMPRRSLELISCGNKYLSNDATSKLIKSVTPKSAFKIFSTYPTPWWQKLNLSLGRSLTDLPLRQTYYWADSQGNPVKSGPAMLMASYDDGTNTEFWDGYRDLSSTKWKLKGLQQTEKSTVQWTDDAPKWSDYKAPSQMMDEMTRQLAEIHGVKAADIQPVKVFFKDWAEDPFGGGWNFWNIGVQSSQVMKAIIKPDSTVPLYICGDAYSNWQGWVEGALETANMVLALPEFNVRPLNSDKLSGRTNEFLAVGDGLVSKNNQYKLIYQHDGNLVLYRILDNYPLWATNTNGKPAWRVYMQPDGNFVVYEAYKKPVWASNTNHDDDSYIIIQDDGNLVIYDRQGKSVWESNVASKKELMPL